MQKSWQDKVNNDCVRTKTGQSLLECTLQKQRLRRFGHEQRMENVSSARHTLHWMPTEKRKTEDYMERHTNEGHQRDECDVG